MEPTPVFCIQLLTKGQILGISGPLSPRNNYVISSLDTSYTRLSIISSSVSSSAFSIRLSKIATLVISL